MPYRQGKDALTDYWYFRFPKQLLVRNVQIMESSSFVPLRTTKQDYFNTYFLTDIAGAPTPGSLA